MPLTTKVRAVIEASLEGAHDFSLPKFTLPAQADIVMLSGTTNGKADVLFADQRTLAASASENIDLAGALADPLGVAAVFAEVTAILVRAAAGNANNVLVSQAATNGFAGPFTGADEPVSVQPGGAALFVAPNAGWPVTAGTGDLLTIANSAAGSSVTYDLVIVGRSA
jgi:hypothetical protein